MLRGAVLGVTLLAAPAALAAQQTPEQVVTAYYQGMRAGNMAQVAALTHPQALESFKTMIVEMLVAEGDPNGELPVTEAELRAMPADSVYRFFMNGMGDGTNDDDMRALLEGLELEVMGSVARGDDVRYVVFEARGTMSENPVQQMMVLTLRRAGREWRVDPGEGLMNMMGAGLFGLMMSSAMQAGFDGMGEDN
jgi:hypothetical protein